MKLPFIMVLLALSGCAAHQPLPLQSNVDLNKYVGVWHEQARLPNRFQQVCVGDVQARYTLNDDGTIAVENRCRKADGSITMAQGLGRVAKADPRTTSRLEVRFAPAWLSWLPPVWGDYWIMKLEGDYQHALVGTPDRKFLWVLSRDRHADQAVIDRLLQYAGQQGFAIAQVVASH